MVVVVELTVGVTVGVLVDLMVGGWLGRDVKGWREVPRLRPALRT